jgi:hypothetical protein
MATVINFKPHTNDLAERLAQETLAPAPTSPLAQDLPREYQELIASLKRCGVQRVYGVFSAENWHQAATNAGLYLIGGNNWCTANVAKIRKTAEDLADELNNSASLVKWTVGAPAEKTVQWYIERGDLLQTLFPDGSGLHPESLGTARIRVYYPRPRMDDLRAMHSARLAGLTVGIAAPPKALMVEIADLIADAQAHIVRRKIAQAKRKRELARQRARERAQEQARIDRDPIVFGTDGTHTVVLGHYNTSENDPEELRSLVATLDTLAFDL